MSTRTPNPGSKIRRCVASRISWGFSISFGRSAVLSMQLARADRLTVGLWMAIGTSSIEPCSMAHKGDSAWVLEFMKNPSLLENPDQHSQFLARLDAGRTKLFWLLAGESERAIFIGGKRADALLYFWNGAAAVACGLPASGYLRDILIAPDGIVWICGGDGLLLRGNGRDFEVVLDLDRGPAFHPWPRSRSACTSDPTPVRMHSTFSRTERQPQCAPGSPAPESAHTMEAVGGVLWVVGMKDLVRFDGDRWERIAVPGVRA